jgi:hypothetical protein
MNLLGIDQDTVLLKLKRHEVAALACILGCTDKEAVKEVAAQIWGSMEWDDEKRQSWDAFWAGEACSSEDFLTFYFLSAADKINTTWNEMLADASARRETRLRGPAILGVPPGELEDEGDSNPGGNR